MVKHVSELNPISNNKPIVQPTLFRTPISSLPTPGPVTGLAGTGLPCDAAAARLTGGDVTRLGEARRHHLGARRGAGWAPVFRVWDAMWVCVLL